ncbi:hypothetical protein QQZ08_001629 [Neonectria magnoliae]|uniref:Uncharacterized protein n=1 Tax=Neonectria magnoliae TaxID=2732573 RepID=A0ABR1IFD0_9HYPO
MSHGRPPRPLTPETEALQLPTTKVTFKPLTLRGYRSAEILRGLKIASPSPKSLDSKTGRSPLAAPLAKRGLNMFSSFFSHTQAHQPHENIEIDAGDFDHTPAPSARSSLSLLRRKVEAAGVSDETSATPVTSHRHHLLKALADSPIVVDKDFPVPPMLSPNSTKIKLLQVQEERVRHKNKELFPPGMKPIITKATSPAILAEQEAFAPSVPAADRIRSSSLSNLHTTHASENLQSSSSATSVCDDGGSERQLKRLWPPPANCSPSLVDLTGDQSNNQILSQAVPHGSVKVHPAFNYCLIRRQDSRESRVRAVNKVGPFNLLEGEPASSAPHDDEDTNEPLLSSLEFRLKNGKADVPTETTWSTDQFDRNPVDQQPNDDAPKSRRVSGARVRFASTKEEPSLQREAGEAQRVTELRRDDNAQEFTQEPRVEQLPQSSHVFPTT